MKNGIELGKEKYGNVVDLDPMSPAQIKQYQDEYDALSHDEKQVLDIQNPGHVNEGLWEKAKKISMKSYGELRYPFIMSMYKKLGGK